MASQPAREAKAVGGTTPVTPSQYLTNIFSLAGKTVLITGGTRGIGAQLTVALASAGADIILLVRNAQDETVKSTYSKVVALNRACSIHPADLLDRKKYLQSIEEMLRPDEQNSKPDIFVHCAGLQHRAPAIDFPEAQWDKIVEVNLTSGFLIVQALARHWLASVAPAMSFPSGSKPKVVFISSVLSGGPGSNHVPAYVATKGSIHQLTKALSNEWAPRGICVNSLAPGYIETELTASIRTDKVAEEKLLDRVPMGRWGGEGDLEGAVIWLSGRGSDFVSGTTVVVDGGFTAR